uniref:Uncharacterized protein n=1 Tax=Oryza barthii TaxID=65489 RepID=A0A0D3GM51_9ORYZ
MYNTVNNPSMHRSSDVDLVWVVVQSLFCALNQDVSSNVTLTSDGIINSNMHAQALTMVGCGRGSPGTYHGVPSAMVSVEGQHDAAQPVAIVPWRLLLWWFNLCSVH